MVKIEVGEGIVELTPVQLTGAHVRLEPLGHHHVAGLCEVGLEPDLTQSRFRIASAAMPKYSSNAARTSGSGPR